MEIKGTVVQILAPQTGEGKNGQWKKQEYILETEGQYPKKVCVEAWGDKVDEFSLSEGQVINASINIESREYNGRWFTNVRLWKVEKETSGAMAQDDFNQDVPMPNENDELISDVSDDEIPF